MTSEEILKEAFDSDVKLLNKAFESDRELLEIINKEICDQTTAIWTCLIDKGIIKIEEFKRYQEEAKKFGGKE